MTQFKQRDGQLLIGNFTLRQLESRVGQTPFYAYDRQLIKQRIEIFRQHMPEDLLLHYAIKANPMPALVDFIQPQVDGMDVASLGELNIALNSGMAPEQISFAGPGKNELELQAAIACGITLHCESATELERLKRISDQLGIKAKVALRINPDFTLKNSGMKMGGGAQPFGIDAEVAPQLLQQLDRYHLDFVGFHIYSGSQNLNADAIMKMQNETFQLSIKLMDLAPQVPQIINIGGGLGIPYFPGEKRLNLADIGENLHQQMDYLHLRYPHVKVVMELGRFLVAEAGIYVCKVLDIKTSRGEKFLITNGGLHHHLAASGNFGQIIRKNYPVAIDTKIGTQHEMPIETQKEVVSVVGPLCTPLDILSAKMSLPVANIGDLVVIYQSGAYGLSASPQHFLSHPAAAEILV
ncbi:MAG: pyridoxal-dependent decarboxylase, exosortase A system-associated [Gammaproteobacteria bacterium CG22_combo_CG10-13_8_21_14_all_40_8]|nr:MAG: pyridoxal-dependent decarboxylase, exosortase A system-associated [Gammaproteobacteria bacterium CG22_combo_CG10-13_8_21_14_all_40_8]